MAKVTLVIYNIMNKVAFIKFAGEAHRRCGKPGDRLLLDMQECYFIQLLQVTFEN